MRRKKFPIGIESFEEIRKEGFYYVDKTGLLRDLLDNWGKVNLFTRPRRFGKTLNMSMLKCFFEIGADKTLFDGLAISRETDLCDMYMGRFPVVFLSLKGVDGLTFED
ncbi:MAG: AAA family ATPase, partial [Lachnospiraceae bacterium]|nr:AAA family ATPase [Lachnospiraceae bacterium]